MKGANRFKKSGGNFVMTARSAILVTCTLLISGCIATPKVQYAKVSGPDELPAKAFDTYFLQSSQIEIDSDEPSEQDSASPAKKKASKPATKRVDLKIVSTPQEFTAFKLAMVKNDPFWQRTSLNLTKHSNTELVQEAGSSVANNSVEIINQVGAFAKAVVPLAAAFAVGEKPLLLSSLPAKIDVQREITKLPADGRGEVPLRPIPGVLITLGPIPPDAIEASKLKFPLASERFLYSACRTADVNVTVQSDGSKKTQSFSSRVKVADPNYIQQVAFPPKGKITAHSECGVSVVSEPTDNTANALVLGTAVAVQAKALSDAIAASKKKSGAKE
jgi:hypothetical protein